MLNTRGVQITWLGHAAFRVRSGGKVFYLDPLLTGNPLCPEAEKTPQACDAILLTHGHADHVGDTVALAQRTGAQVVAIVELGNFVASQGVAKDKIVAANKGGTFPVAGAQVTMVHADHSSS